MFCTSCGKQIEDGSSFCVHCGAKVEPSAPTASADQPETQPVQTETATAAPVATAAPPTEKKPMDKKTKIGLIAAAAVIVLFFGLKAILGAVLAPDKTIGKFVDAIREQDADAFRQVTTVYMDELELTDEMLAPFFERYSGDLDALASFSNTLTQDLNASQYGGVATGNGTFRLIQKSSNILFTSYAVEVTPITVYIYSEFDDTQLTIAGQSYTAGSIETTIRALPGVYDGTATYTSPETGVTLEETIEDYYLDAYDNYLSVYFDYTSMWIESYSRSLELKDIEIDGKSYTGDLSGYSFYNGFSIYPVNPESTVVITATAHGMDFEETFDLSESTNCYFRNYQLPEQQQEEAETIGTDVVLNWAKIVTSYDTAACDALTAAYSETSPDFVEDVNNWLSRRVDGASSYTTCKKYTEEPTVEDLTVTVEVSNSGVTVYVDIELSGTLQDYYYVSGELVGEPYENTEDCRATLSYVDGAWSVVSASY